MVERLLEPVILWMNATPGDSRRHRGIVQNRRKVEPAGFPVFDRQLRIEHVNAPHHLVHGAKSELSHVLPNLLRNEEKEIDYMLGLPLELLAQHRILRRNAYRAGVEVALAHHDATHRNQGSGGKAEFFGP